MVVAILVLIVSPFFIFYISALGRTHHSVESLPNTEIALVLGASASKKKGPSPILEGRAQAAASLYFAGKVGKILISGDHQTIQYDEVTPVRTYLLARGVPMSDIWEDPNGTDTYTSVQHAISLFSVKTITIVSQGFHLPRAVFIAESTGVDAYGFVAPGGASWRNLLREIPASGKAIIDIVSSR